MPFGRVATDTNRLGILERDRSLPPGELYDRIDHALERFGRRLAVPDRADDERASASTRSAAR